MMQAAPTPRQTILCRPRHFPFKAPPRRPVHRLGGADGARQSGNRRPASTRLVAPRRCVVRVRFLSRRSCCGLLARGSCCWSTAGWPPPESIFGRLPARPPAPAGRDGFRRTATARLWATMLPKPCTVRQFERHAGRRSEPRTKRPYSWPSVLADTNRREDRAPPSVSGQEALALFGQPARWRSYSK